MNYETLEDQVYVRLSFMATADITVVKMPEVEADRSRPLPTKAKVTVIYAGSEYALPASTSQVSQEEKIFIQILVESTFLRGPQGIYNLISVLKSALIGFQPSFCRRIQVVKHHTIGSDDAEKINNMWVYTIVFQTTALSVEDYTEDLSVLLKKITLVDKPGNETNVIPNPEND